MAKKRPPQLYTAQITHNDGYEYYLAVRELFDAVIIDKMKYPKKTATYLIVGDSPDIEMTASPRLAQYHAHKTIYEDNYDNGDAKH